MTDFFFLSTLTFARFRVTFAARETLVLPRYKGSAFRGCFGESFRRAVCTKPEQPCETCSERYSCPFSLLFNSFVSPSHLHVRKYPKSPHPYIIEPEPDDREILRSGEAFGFVFMLIGSAIKLSPVIAGVFQLMGETGIGRGRGKFGLAQLESQGKNRQYQPYPIPAPPEIQKIGNPETTGVGNRLTLRFETPLRLKKEGKLMESAPPFGLFAERLAQRLGLLAHFHCGAPWPATDKAGFVGAAENVRISKSEMLWVDWRRYSGTQDTKMNFDGYVGDIVYEGDVAPWMPLTAAGAELHAGLSATFGLGKYHIVP